MSSAFFIVLKEEIPNFDPFVNGKALARAEQQLNNICVSLSLTPLMEFFSSSPEDLGGFLAGEGLDIGDFEMPESKWFSASDGLRTVRGLINYSSSHSDEIDDAILSDLNEFEKILNKANEHNIEWHLEVDF